ncbi:hypothetical protein GF380_01585 [Candidatus Uhrbacteria bacterium]|nr:hypothetical protein [Candidatus Uhrbacteria bacterium]MBD3283959.1 hypothetical protein [Candidatus Uhrbacteria bacterium]
MSEHSPHLSNEELFLYAKGLKKHTETIKDHLAVCPKCMDRFLYALDVTLGRRSSINPEDLADADEDTADTVRLTAPEHITIDMRREHCLTTHQLMVEVTREEKGGSAFPSKLTPHLEKQRCGYCMERYQRIRHHYWVLVEGDYGRCRRIGLRRFMQWLLQFHWYRIFLAWQAFVRRGRF